MSLLAYKADTHEEIESFAFTCEQWKEMKKEPVGTYLMRHTGWPAVLKTSRYGTQFFAHKAGFKGERQEQERVSAEHIKVQVELVTALRNAGYVAQVERRGIDIDEQQWIADVYFEAYGNKFAIEVQLSTQHFDEYLRRTERYKRSGLHCIWLLNLKNFTKITNDFFVRKKPEITKNGTYPRSFPDLAYLPLDFQTDDSIKAIVFPAPKEAMRLSLSNLALGLAKGNLFYSVEFREWAWKQ